MLQLIKINDIAPAGKQSGAILGLVRDTRRDEDGHDIDELVLTADLDATDKAGKKYRLVKRYKLGPESRGLATFRNDFTSFSGRKLKDQDLVAFDADALMANRRAMLKIKHRKDGKEIVAVLDTILPAPAPAQATS